MGSANCRLQVMASNLPAEEIAGLKVVFEEMDANKNGSITVEELREALQRKGKDFQHRWCTCTPGDVCSNRHRLVYVYKPVPVGAYVGIRHTVSAYGIRHRHTAYGIGIRVYAGPFTNHN